MLSPKLSKILAEKNVVHDGGMYWHNYELTAYSYRKVDWYLDDMTYDEHDSHSNQYTRNRHRDQEEIPAYPEISLFTGAPLIWNEDEQADYRNPCPHCGGKLEIANPTGNCSHVHYPEDCEVCLKRSRGFKYHTHTLADLFSSGASPETIEEYVLSSLEGKL